MEERKIEHKELELQGFEEVDVLQVFDGVCKDEQEVTRMKKKMVKEAGGGDLKEMRSPFMIGVIAKLMSIGKMKVEMIEWKRGRMGVMEQLMEELRKDRIHISCRQRAFLPLPTDLFLLLLLTCSFFLFLSFNGHGKTSFS